MCGWVAAVVLLLIAVHIYTPNPAHIAWKGVSHCDVGNTTLEWTLMQRHANRMDEGNTVLAQLRIDCTGDVNVHWSHTVNVTCPVDITSILTYPPTVVFETTHPQRVRAQLDMVRLHDVPKLTKWMSL